MPVTKDSDIHAVRMVNLLWVCGLVVCTMSSFNSFYRLEKNSTRLLIDEIPACEYNARIIEYWSGCLFPRMGRPNGEAGARPALSRNCESAEMPTSQAARPGQFYTLSWNGGGNGATDCLFPSPVQDRGFCFGKSSMLSPTIGNTN
jgi:hypothetical protein